MALNNFVTLSFQVLSRYPTPAVHDERNWKAIASEISGSFCTHNKQPLLGLGFKQPLFYDNEKNRQSFTQLTSQERLAG